MKTQDFIDLLHLIEEAKQTHKLEPLSDWARKKMAIVEAEQKHQEQLDKVIVELISSGPSCSP